MKAVFILPILAIVLSPVLQTATQDEGPVKVLSFKWSKIQQANPQSGSNPLAARAVNQNDKNFERNNRERSRRDARS